MKKTILFLAILFLSRFIVAQTVYVDFLTVPAMLAYGETLKKQQEETNNNLSDIKKAQLLVFSQLEVANNLQNKIVKGLTTVSGIVKDGLTVKYIIETTQDIIDEIAETAELAKDNPKYTIFAHDSAKEFYQRAIALGTEVTNAVTGGEVNMMNAGERHKLLNHIYTELRIVYASSFGMKNSIKWAIRRGFWQSLNPFSAWVNQDKQIMDEIMRNAKLF